MRERILEAVQREKCELGESDAYGARYVVDFTWRRNDRKAGVRTTWIVKSGEKVPRLTSCYVL